MSKTRHLKMFAAVFLISIPFFAQTKTDYDTKIEAISSINWITKQFVTNISLDTNKADIQMPSGKKVASTYIKSKMLPLIQPPLLFYAMNCSAYQFLQRVFYGKAIAQQNREEINQNAGRRQGSQLKDPLPGQERARRHDGREHQERGNKAL